MSPRNASVRAPPVSNDNGGGEEGYCLVQGAPAPSRATSTTPQRISDSTEQSIDERDCQDVRPVPIVRFTGGQQSRTVSSPQPWPPSGITVSQTFSRAGAPQVDPGGSVVVVGKLVQREELRRDSVSSGGQPFTTGLKEAEQTPQSVSRMRRAVTLGTAYDGSQLPSPILVAHDDKAEGVTPCPRSSKEEEKVEEVVRRVEYTSTPSKVKTDDGGFKQLTAGDSGGTTLALQTTNSSLALREPSRQQWVQQQLQQQQQQQHQQPQQQQLQQQQQHQQLQQIVVLEHRQRLQEDGGEQQTRMAIANFAHDDAAADAGTRDVPQPHLELEHLRAQLEEERKSKAAAQALLDVARMRNLELEEAGASRFSGRAA